MRKYFDRLKVFVQVLQRIFKWFAFYSNRRKISPILSQVTFARRYFRYFSYFSTFGAVPTDRWRYLANCFFRFPSIDKSGNDESYRVGLVLGWKRNTKLDTLWARKRKKKREREIKGELGKGEDVSRKRWSSILTMTLQQPNISQFHARFRYASL